MKVTSEDLPVNLSSLLDLGVTQTLKGNQKQFELAVNSSYQGKSQWNFDERKGNLVRVCGEFKLSEFELLRFYHNKEQN